MIDLHMHTKYSDGDNDLETLLKNASDVKLDVISITDHDTCASYFEMENKDISKLFEGRIIVGCEFTTSYNGHLIEILGYGIDYKKVQKFLNRYYNLFFRKKRSFTMYSRLVKKIKELDLNCDLSKFSRSYISLYKLYMELLKESDNIKKIDEDIFDNYVDFYRKGIYNPKSKLYLNYVDFLPDIETILELIHSSGGVAVLAHPYVYKFDNTLKYLNEMFDKYNIDGIECYYSTFTNEEVNSLIDFANKRNLLKSVGSDYHGSKREGHELGKLNVSKDIISNWNINYYKKN